MTSDQDVPLTARASGVDPPPADDPPQRGRFRGWRKGGAPYLFVLPAVAFVVTFLIWPFFRTLMLSFTDKEAFGEAEFIGFDNYLRFFQDPILRDSLVNTFIWLGASLVLPVLIGLAVALGTFRLAGGTLYRLSFILPYALSGTAVGIVWTFVLQTDGVANNLLEAFGLGAWVNQWLLEPPLNTFSMIVAATWQVVGINVILFAVGLQAMPRDPIDAARVDGASGWNMLRHVILPLIRPMTVVVVGMTLVNSLRTFDIIWLMTQGGPYRSSETLAVTMFREAFLLFRHGYAAAIAVLLTVFIVLISGTYLRRQLRQP